MPELAVGFDYETFYSSKLKYGLKQMIAETYVRHELFDPYMLAVCDGKNSWAGNPRDFNWNALEGQTLVSHNRYFDNTVYNEMVRRNWAPKINFKAWHCTANLTSYLCNRRALDSAVEFLYGIKLSKAARADADGKRWPNDFSEQERAEMLKYAPGDAYWCQKLWMDHADKWPEMERRLSNQTIEQGMFGVAINEKLLSDYIVQTHEMKLNTENVIPWIRDSEDDSWDEFNTKPTSTKCIAEQCRRSGIPCPPVKAHDGEEAFEEWQALYVKANPWIAALGSWRSINKLYKSFLLMKARMRNDGTMPFGLKYFGAHTGRWSGAEKINFQNPRKKPVICADNGLMETNEIRIDKALDQKDETGTYPDWVKYSIDFRSLIIPRPGFKMITCDLAQIEPRVLAWLCGNTALLDAIRGGMGIYEAFARANMGYDGPPMVGAVKRSDYYKMIKIQVLGLGYGAGWEKFITIAADGGVDLTAEDPEFMEETNPFTGEVKKVSGYGKRSREVVEEFRRRMSKITDLWKNLDETFKRSVGSDFNINMPSGRRLSYRDVRCAQRIEADKKTGKPVRKTVFTAESDGRRKIYYGGKLTENVTQALARDCFGYLLLKVEDSGKGRALFSSHDEGIFECPMSSTAAEIEAIMSETPSWLPGCPIAAEAKEVAHYQK